VVQGAGAVDEQLHGFGLPCAPHQGTGLLAVRDVGGTTMLFWPGLLSNPAWTPSSASSRRAASVTCAPRRSGQENGCADAARGPGHHRDLAL
ncbi:MAG: hypothetical protein M3324_09510, partial [Actinomycetota bacterium]|nr:hypothetical protein [Actinomycetota bacterium]